MTSKEQEFRDKILRALEQYIPNADVLDGISTYLYRETLSVLRTMTPDEIQEELANEIENTEFDILVFRGFIRDIALAAAGNFILAVSNNAYLTMKNRIEEVVREPEKPEIDIRVKSDFNASMPVSVRRDTPKSSRTQFITQRNQNEAEFEIDLELASKTSVKYDSRKVQTAPVSSQNQVVQDFEESDLAQDAASRNMRSVASFATASRLRTANQGLSSSGGNEGKSLDADYYYSEVPNIDTGLDY